MQGIPRGGEYVGNTLPAALKRLAALVVCLVVAGCGGESPSSPSPTPTVSYASELQLCIDQTNQYRASVSRPRPDALIRPRDVRGRSRPERRDSARRPPALHSNQRRGRRVCRERDSVVAPQYPWQRPRGRRTGTGWHVGRRARRRSPREHARALHGDRVWRVRQWERSYGGSGVPVAAASAQGKASSSGQSRSLNPLLSAAG